MEKVQKFPDRNKNAAHVWDVSNEIRFFTLHLSARLCLFGCLKVGCYVNQFQKTRNNFSRNYNKPPELLLTPLMASLSTPHSANYPLTFLRKRFSLIIVPLTPSPVRRSGLQGFFVLFFSLFLSPRVCESRRTDACCLMSPLGDKLLGGRLFGRLRGLQETLGLQMERGRQAVRKTGVWTGK